MTSSSSSSFQVGDLVWVLTGNKHEEAGIVEKVECEYELEDDEDEESDDEDEDKKDEERMCFDGVLVKLHVSNRSVVRPPSKIRPFHANEASSSRSSRSSSRRRKSAVVNTPAAATKNPSSVATTTTTSGSRRRRSAVTPSPIVAATDSDIDSKPFSKRKQSSLTEEQQEDKETKKPKNKSAAAASPPVASKTDANNTINANEKIRETLDSLVTVPHSPAEPSQATTGTTSTTTESPSEQRAPQAPETTSSPLAVMKKASPDENSNKKEQAATASTKQKPPGNNKTATTKTTTSENAKETTNSSPSKAALVGALKKSPPPAAAAPAKKKKETTTAAAAAAGRQIRKKPNMSDLKTCVVIQDLGGDAAPADDDANANENSSDNSDDESDYDQAFQVEYSPSSRSTCRRCDQVIHKGAVRISHVPLFRGKPGYRVYRHLECALFSEKIQQAEDVGGWKKLEQQDYEFLVMRIEEAKMEVEQENASLEPDELVQASFAGEMRSPPPGLTANLLPFQVEGVSWMYHQEVHVPEIRGGYVLLLFSQACMHATRDSNYKPESSHTHLDD